MTGILSMVLMGTMLPGQGAQSAPSAGSAQTAQFHFQFKPKQELTYHREQTNKTISKVKGKTTTLTSKTVLDKKWTVTEVLADGSAKIQMTLTKLRLEQTGADGKTLVFDSSDPKGSDAALAEKLTPMVGKPIIELHVLKYGAVKERKSLVGAENLLTDLPFSLVMPLKPFKRGFTWKWPFTVDVPGDAGKTLPIRVEQRCVAEKIEGPQITIALVTTVLEEPRTLPQQAALAPNVPTGTVVLNSKTGQLQSLNLTSSRRMLGFQGEGSEISFTSEIKEQLVD